MALTTVSLIFAFSQEMLFTAQDVLAFRLNGFTIENLPLRLRLKHLLLFQMSLTHPSEKHCGHAGEMFSAEEEMRAVYQCYIFSVGKVWCYAELIGRHRNYHDYHFEANKRCLEIILSTFHIENV